MRDMSFFRHKCLHLLSQKSAWPWPCDGRIARCRSGVGSYSRDMGFILDKPAGAPTEGTGGHRSKR